MREPNGRRSRSGRAHEPADLVAIQARMRQFGLSAADARDQLAETVIGRLALRGISGDGISRQQFRAAERYQQVTNNYLKAMSAPGAHYEAMGAAQSGDEDSHAEWCQSCLKTMYGLGKAMSEAERAAWPEDFSGALYRTIIEDREIGGQIGTLRLALNVVVQYFMLDQVAA
ncbi:MAG: hypothetical protein DI629_12200 [Mesorhizobium amorphae]|nr:MAG: hypothetical protein DI629_12200 [Mesorhizobium amorphae]